MPEIKVLDGLEVVAFDDDSQDWGILSNSALTPITVDTNDFGTQVFPSVEHYLQFMYGPTNKKLLEAIQKAPTAELAVIERKRSVTESGKNAEHLEFGWKFNLIRCLQYAIYIKASQHPKFHAALEASKNACVVYDTGKRAPDLQNGILGIMTGGEVDFLAGGNLLGVVLMQERARIYQRQRVSNGPALTNSAIEKENQDILAVPFTMWAAVRKILTGKYPDKNLSDVLESIVKPDNKPPGGAAAPLPNNAHHGVISSQADLDKALVTAAEPAEITKYLFSNPLTLFNEMNSPLVTVLNNAALESKKPQTPETAKNIENLLTVAKEIFNFINNCDEKYKAIILTTKAGADAATTLHKLVEYGSDATLTPALRSTFQIMIKPIIESVNFAALNKPNKAGATVLSQILKNAFPLVNPPAPPADLSMQTAFQEMLKILIAKEFKFDAEAYKHIEDYANLSGQPVAWFPKKPLIPITPAPSGTPANAPPDTSKPQPVNTAAPTSTLSMQTSAFDNSRTGVFNEPAKVQKILTRLNSIWPDQQWQEKSRTPTSVTIADVQNNSFTIEKDSIKTSANNVETFKAMLVSFQVLNQHPPKISITDAGLKPAWEQACRELNIKAQIEITPKKDPEPEESPSMRPR